MFIDENLFVWFTSWLEDTTLEHLKIHQLLNKPESYLT